MVANPLHWTRMEFFIGKIMLTVGWKIDWKNWKIRRIEVSPFQHQQNILFGVCKRWMTNRRWLCPRSNNSQYNDCDGAATLAHGSRRLAATAAAQVDCDKSKIKISDIWTLKAMNMNLVMRTSLCAHNQWGSCRKKWWNRCFSNFNVIKLIIGLGQPNL